MQRKATAVMCIAQSHQQAEVIVNGLKAASFSANDISVLLPNRDGTKDFAYEHNTKAPEGAVAGIGAGGMIGGTVGVLAGLGLLVIPGLGALLAAGPLLAALSGAAAGAAVGGVAGALIGVGIPEMEAKRYEGKVKGGNILISVLAYHGDEKARAIAIYKAAGAEDICSASEAPVPDHNDLTKDHKRKHGRPTMP